jgi:ParB family transcriptional regulator, chromosome partitioning protein
MGMSVRKPLGRGLDALIPGRPVAPPPGPLAAALPAAPAFVPVDAIVQNPDQPRQQFDPAALDDLTASINQHGILQPLVVRATDSGYELIAGERRWRAAQRAGLREVPVVIRTATGGERLELALIENLQRADLDALEEAEAFRRLADEYGLTQDDIARQVGKSRSSVANALRLLSLPGPVKEMLRSGTLSAGHARAVLAVSGEAAQLAFAREVVERGLSKASAEQQVTARRTKPTRRAPKLTIDIHLRALTEELTRSLGTRVRIIRSPKGGTIEIEFYSDGELDRLADQLRAVSANRSALL